MASAGTGTATAKVAPAAARLAGSRASTSPWLTAPEAISTFSRSRDSVGTASASARSRRQPSAVGVMVAWMMETPRSMS